VPILISFSFTVVSDQSSIDRMTRLLATRTLERVDRGADLHINEAVFMLAWTERATLFNILAVL
jgi:hypothetical protein